jgi:VanZ family protein
LDSNSHISIALGRPLVRTLICVSIFISAFVVTHLPPPDQPIKPLEHDKLLHMTGFFVLGAMVVWRLGSLRATLPVPVAMVWYALLLTYAAFDELTQPIMGRSCELYDFLSDGLGGAMGMGLMMLTYPWWRASTRVGG